MSVAYRCLSVTRCVAQLANGCVPPPMISMRSGRAAAATSIISVSAS